MPGLAPSLRVPYARAHEDGAPPGALGAAVLVGAADIGLGVIADHVDPT